MDNFIVSARKYRPSTFQTVVGQHHITSTLRNAIERNQLAHAYLFCGPRGVGKTTCARIFAKAINCLSPRDSDACGECESCVSFGEGRSLNIHELDAASNNSVDDIRTLTDQVRIPPQIGKYSVYIIDEVHMLSTQAFNAFLKTLEEPPAHAVFVLATTEKHKIIPTILSRCQIFDFNRIRVEDGVKYIEQIASKEGVSYDDESLHLIARKADGSMRDALSMFDKAVSFCGSELHFKRVAETLNVLDYDSYFSIVAMILKGSYPAVLTLFDSVLSSGFSGQSFIGGLNSHFRDLLMCKEPSTISLLEVTGTLLESYKEQSKLCEVGFLFDSISILTEVDSSLRMATNQRLNIELGLMKLCGLAQKKKLIPNQSYSLPNLESTTTELEGVASVAESAYIQQTRTKTDNSKLASSDVDENLAISVESGGDGGVSNLESKSSAELEKHLRADDSAEAEFSGSKADVAKIKTEPKTEVEVGHTQKVGDNVAAESNVELERMTEADQSLQPSNLASDETNSNSRKTTPEQQFQPQQKPIKNVGVSTISGPSIADLMDSRPEDELLTDSDQKAEEIDNKLGETERYSADRISEDQSRLMEIKGEFIEALNRERPRIAMAFHSMQVVGREISISVPTQELYEEIMRNRSEIHSILADLADLNGAISFKIDIVESSGERSLIKFEDRLQFLTELNPHLTQLRQKLELIE